MLCIKQRFHGCTDYEYVCISPSYFYHFYAQNIFLRYEINKFSRLVSFFVTCNIPLNHGGLLFCTFFLLQVCIPALVWESLAMQSQDNAKISLSVESWTRSINNFIPAADDKACSVSGMILAKTTT